jgi:CTP:molybdopterin cytidylyltransferase MocA
VKQLALLNGRPLLEYALKTMADAKSIDRRVVVLGCGADQILERVDLHGSEAVVCEDWQEGLAASLRTGVVALGDVRAAVVILGDQPLISAEAVEHVLAANLAHRYDAARATYGGIPGHPVALGHKLLARTGELHGDDGFGPLLRVSDVRDVPCDGYGQPTDIDRRSELELIGRCSRGRGGCERE